MKKHTFARLITVMLVLATMTAVFAVSAFADGASAAVTTDKQNATRGEEVVVTVSVNAQDVTAARVALTYDNDVFELLSGEFTAAVSGAAMKNFASSTASAVLAWENQLDLDGGVLAVKFKVKTDAEFASTDIGLTVKVEIDGVISETDATGAQIKVVCAASAHTWDAATCTAPKTCSTCGLTEGAEKGHDWNNATCYAPKTCEACGVTEGDPVDHSYTFKDPTDAYKAEGATCEDAATYYYKCLYCNEHDDHTYTFGNALGHTGGTASCTEKATCTRCGEKYGDFLHNFNKEVVADEYFASEATCTEKAKYYKSCECGAAGSETFESDILAAHTYAQNMSAEHLKSAATCTAKAVYFVSCSECGANGTETFEFGEKLEHTYGSEWKSDGNGHWNVCSCGAKSAAQSHTWNKGEVTKAATEDAEGEKTFTCTKCSATKTESIAKLVPSEEGDSTAIWIVCGVLVAAALVVIVAVIFRKSPAPKAPKENAKPDVASEEDGGAKEEAAEDSEKASAEEAEEEAAEESEEANNEEQTVEEDSEEPRDDAESN